jgi:hypothetical protein
VVNVNGLLPKQFCMVVSPAPTLISSSDRHTKYSRVLEIKERLSARNLSAVVCPAPSKEDFKSCLKHSKYLVYIGTGVGYEYSGDKDSISESLLFSCGGQLPKLVVICLEHGARKIAHQLSESSKASKVHVIVWISASIGDVTDNISDLLQDIVNLDNETIVAETLKNITSPLSRKFGVINGKAFGNSKTKIVSIAGKGDGAVHIVPKHSFPWNNILLGKLGIEERSQQRRREKADSDLVLAAQDIALFQQLTTVAHAQGGKGERHSIISISPDAKRMLRHRSVVFEVLKTCLTESSVFDMVYRVQTEKELEEFKSCFEMDTFSSIIRSNDSINRVLL